MPSRTGRGRRWCSPTSRDTRPSRVVVGTSTRSRSVSAWRLPPITSLPISAKPIALIRNSSRFCCSSTMRVAEPRWSCRRCATQIGCRIAVGGERRYGRFDVVGQVRQARVDLGQKRVEVRQGLADLLAAAVERRRDRAEGLVEFRRVDLVQHGDELLEDGVDLGGDVLALDHLPSCSVCEEGSFGGTSSTYLAPNTVDDAMSTATLAGMRCSCDGSMPA